MQSSVITVLQPTSERFSSALALRELRNVSNGRQPTLRSRHGGQLLAVLDAKARRVYANRPLEFLVDTLAAGDSGFAELGQPNGQRPHPSARLVEESFDRLCWIYGLRLGREVGLAPWIDPDRKYRLVCWPDFAQIGGDLHGAAVCTALSGRNLSVSEIAAATQLPHRVVCGVLNALSLCACIALSRPTPQQRGDTSRAARAAGQPGVFARLMRRLRGR
jgi:hypothetical protein